MWKFVCVLLLVCIVVVEAGYWKKVHERRQPSKRRNERQFANWKRLEKLELGPKICSICKKRELELQEKALKDILNAEIRSDDEPPLFNLKPGLYPVKEIPEEGITVDVEDLFTTAVYQAKASEVEDEAEDEMAGNEDKMADASSATEATCCPCDKSERDDDDDDDDVPVPVTISPLIVINQCNGKKGVTEGNVYEYREYSDEYEVEDLDAEDEESTTPEQTKSVKDELEKDSEETEPVLLDEEDSVELKRRVEEL